MKKSLGKKEQKSKNEGLLDSLTKKENKEQNQANLVKPFDSSFLSSDVSFAKERAITQQTMQVNIRKAVDLNTMSDEDKKGLLFGTHLDKQLGKMVGKVSDTDPYRAILPPNLKK